MIQRFSIGAVFAKSFSVLLSNFVPFFLISAIINLPLILYGVYFALHLRTIDPRDAESFARSGSFVMVGLGLFLGPIASGAVTFGVVQHLRDKPVSLSECMSVGLARLFPVLGVAIVSGILIVLGMIALIVPGLIAACTLYVAVPAAVLERTGVRGSLSRSAALTSGARWGVFCILFLIGLIDKGGSKLIEIALLNDRDSFLVYMLAVLSASVFMSAWQAAAAAVSYYHLRSMKESVDIEEIASVFD